MTLLGSRLGSYELHSLLGKGGMGEVYRARDRRLGRDVAIKILPPALAGDPERLSRFEREAQVLASLNHPHIGAIYGLEETDGVHALVLELVEGQTLAERVGRGRIPAAEAIAIARQIADALDAAHERGIVHRDLKPANIKITPDGTVKVLDFGLAKATGQGRGSDTSPSALTQSPTALTGPTSDGVILGTATYMSPEQARGLAVDKRTDIWAFGCVLFEMLAGRSPFARDTLPDTLAAVLEHPPDWTALPPAIDPRIGRVIRRCLEKDPRRRLRDIADARSDLDEAEAGGPSSVPARARTSLTPLAWTAAALLGASAAAGVWWWTAGARPQPREPRLLQITDALGVEESPAVSPDGRTVAYVAPVNGRRQIWVQLLAGGAPLQITHDEWDHFYPRWSPDSNALIYHTPGDSPDQEGTVWEISALGGTARPIARALSGGDVSPDGRTIALFQHADNGVALVAALRDGSGHEMIRSFALSEPAFLYPRWSPDGDAIAFQRSESAEFDKRIYVVPSAGGEPLQVARAADLRGLAWLPDGSGIVYSSPAGSTVLYPPTFNLRLVGRDGTGDRPLTFGDTSYIEPDTHVSGALFASRVRSQSNIWRLGAGPDPKVNTAGAERITRRTSAAQTPSVSPDGRELVYLSDSGGHGNLWIASTDGSAARQLTFERDPAVSIGVPVWSSRGSAIAFIVTRNGVTSQWIINRDGSGLKQLVPRGVWSFWSPDDAWLYYTVPHTSDLCIEKIPKDGGTPLPIRCDAAAPALSPDGQTLYFARPLRRGTGGLDWEIHRARPEDGPSVVLARISGTRIPVDFYNIHTIPSPDGRWLALPLTDGTTTDVWALSSEDGALRRLTDFGDRALVIARRISWSMDGRSIYAAVADLDADIASLDSVLP